jgi:hypothetical protein
MPYLLAKTGKVLHIHNLFSWWIHNAFGPKRENGSESDILGGRDEWNGWSIRCGHLQRYHTTQPADLPDSQL